MKLDYPSRFSGGEGYWGTDGPTKPLCVSVQSDAGFSLNSSAVYWGDRYIIDIAYDAEAQEFFSHPCCQRYLTARMYGHLQVRMLLLKAEIFRH